MPKTRWREINTSKHFWRENSIKKCLKESLYPKKTQKNIYPKIPEEKHLPTNLWRKISTKNFLKRSLYQKWNPWRGVSTTKIEKFLPKKSRKISTKKTFPSLENRQKQIWWFFLKCGVNTLVHEISSDFIRFKLGKKTRHQNKNLKNFFKTVKKNLYQRNFHKKSALRKHNQRKLILFYITHFPQRSLRTNPSQKLHTPKKNLAKNATEISPVQTTLSQKLPTKHSKDFF